MEEGRTQREPHATEGVELDIAGPRALPNSDEKVAIPSRHAPSMKGLRCQLQEISKRYEPLLAKKPEYAQHA